MMTSNKSDFARLHGLVRGRVQGVNFRAFVMHHAGAMNLNGWVRNLPGGRSVEVWAEGPRDRLEKLVELLRQGPRSARVEEVGVEWSDYVGDFTTFDVRF
jgi:acylphosphatase